MNNIFTIIKKELRRIFTDKRMLAGLILPGILIYLVYSLMGNFMVDNFTPTDNYEYRVVVFNEPESLQAIHQTKDYKIKIIDDYDSVEKAKAGLSNKEFEILIVYDENFESKLGAEQDTDKPNVSIYYNSVSSESAELYTYYSQTISALSVNVTYNFFVNMSGDTFDLATIEDTSTMLIKMLVPFLLVIFLFSGCMSVATESIAGEKERGTIATLLVTPVKRRDIALGKVSALAIAALVSSISSFLGVILSFPKLMGGASESLTLSMYGFATYLEIFILMIITVLLFTVLLSIISTFAKSVKEASQYAMPAMIIVMLLAFPSMMGSSMSEMYVLYFVPVLNIIQCMTAIFSLSFNLLNFITTIVSNIVYIGLGIYLLTRMFGSERIMFNK